MSFPESNNRWLPVWAMSNVDIDKALESKFAALVNCRDTRLKDIIKNDPNLKKFINKFKDEFGKKIYPSIIMFSSDSPESVRTIEALGSFRNAISICTIAASHSEIAKHGRSFIVKCSTAFDIYPWFPAKNLGQHVTTYNPAMAGVHDLNLLRAQPSPALGERSLQTWAIDNILLKEILTRWDNYHGTGSDDIKNRRLFRAIEMARFASRMPGGVDSIYFDGGRIIALWISAFEILAHDGNHSDKERVIKLLSEVDWYRQELKDQSKDIKLARKTSKTNMAGLVCKKLYDIRNDFLHGNSVTQNNLIFELSQKSVLPFAAPLFRLLLTAYLNLRFEKQTPDPQLNPAACGHFITEQTTFLDGQINAEDAILTADKAP